MSASSRQSDGYALARGEKEVERLRLLQRAYGPGSEALLRRAGLSLGMRVLEVGCGSGNMTCWLAEHVGPAGAVVALDNSEAQLEQARRQVGERSLRNVTFAVADATAPDLPAESFDLVYSRLLLMHLTDPLKALRAMAGLVKPGGRVVCEEMDLSRWVCEPPSRLQARSHELKLALSDRRGQHWRVGASLHELFRQAGLSEVAVSANVPLVLRGEEKRLLVISFRELAPQLIQEQFATEAEVIEIVAEMERVAADGSVLLSLPFMVQAWARK
jgi:ubiquinone/menaquinone biosynthesis C-methylase UbiE